MGNFLRLSNSGKVEMDCGNLPDKCFIDAIKVKDICSARILTRKEKEQLDPGTPDVVLRRLAGGNKSITREQFCNNYKHSNDLGITMAFLKSNKNYIVYSNCNEKYKVMQIPGNCVAYFCGKPIPPYSYVTIPVGADGKLERENTQVVKRDMFRKMFRIPMQPVIERHLNDGGRKEVTLYDRNRKPVTTQNSNVSMKLNINNKPKVALGKKEVNTVEVARPQNINNATNNADRLNNLASRNNKYKYTVVNRIVDMNNKPLGFTVRELKSGIQKPLKDRDVAELCSRKEVNNLMLVNRNGRYHLQGNGIVMENLPKVIRT